MDSASARRLRSVSNPYSQWEKAHFSADENKLAVTAKETIQYLNATTFSNLESYALPEYVELSPDFLWYADFTHNYGFPIYDVRTGQMIYMLRTPEEEDWIFKGFVFSPDKKTIATIHSFVKSPDEIVADLWDLESGKIFTTIQCEYYYSGTSCSLVFSPDGKKVAFGTWNDDKGEIIIVYDVASGERIFNYGDEGGFLVAFTSDGKRMAAGCDDWPRSDYICIFDLEDGREVLRFPKKWFLFSYAEFSPDDRLFAYGTASGYLYVHRVSDGELLYAFDNHKIPIRMFSFSPDGKTLASTSEDGSIVLWNVEG